MHCPLQKCPNFVGKVRCYEKIVSFILEIEFTLQARLPDSRVILAVLRIRHVLGRTCIIRCRYGGMIRLYILIRRIIYTAFWMIMGIKQIHVIEY